MTKFADALTRRCNTLRMDLSKAVACTALVLIVLLSAGHALARNNTKNVAARPAGEIKPAMSEQKRPGGRSGTTARSAG